ILQSRQERIRWKTEFCRKSDMAQVHRAASGDGWSKVLHCLNPRLIGATHGFNGKQSCCPARLTLSASGGCSGAPSVVSCRGGFVSDLSNNVRGELLRW